MNMEQALKKANLLFEQANKQGELYMGGHLIYSQEHARIMEDVVYDNEDTRDIDFTSHKFWIDNCGDNWGRYITGIDTAEDLITYVFNHNTPKVKL
jgi:hypothetical protein